ncbi:MAG: transcriptional repressor LexA [Candidatus Heteroscillospira sp.]|jgi:repressor LexA
MRYRNTDTMEQIKKYVDAFYLENVRSPSTSEISDGIGIPRSTAYKYLVAMDERGMLAYDGKTITTGKTKKVKEETVRVAVLGRVSCGLPKYAEENIEEYVSLPVSLFGKGKFFILRADGESMIEAGIEDGDMVVIRQQTTANEGQIVVALVEDETTLKRYYLDKRRRCVRLHPENSEMEDIYVKSCAIQGVAVHVIKALE